MVSIKADKSAYFIPNIHSDGEYYFVAKIESESNIWVKLVKFGKEQLCQDVSRNSHSLI